MKKIVLLIISSFCILSIAIAQITKGSILIGGSLGVGTQKYKSATDTSSSTQWSISPMVGIAVKENTFVGVVLSYGSGTNDDDISQHNYMAGIFFRKYKPLGKNFYLFGQADLSYSHYKYEQKNALTGYYRLQKGNGIALSAFPGVSYAAGKRFYLETFLSNLVSIYYSKRKSESKDFTSAQLNKNEENSFGIGFGAGGNIPLNLGFRFILSKK